MDNNLSRMEVDFYRLLMRCESLASEDIARLKPWRIKAYISTLHSQFNELKKKHSSLNLRECGRRLDELQSQFLDSENLNGTEDISLPGKLVSSVKSDSDAQEREKQHKLHVEKELRQRLLQTNKSVETHKNTRQSETSDQLTKEEVDRIVEQHRKIQEHQLDQLVGLVRDLKESANDANKMVRQDNKTLTQTNVVASRNMDDLTKQKKRLDEAVTRSSTWWLWLLIGLIVIAFISMIVFMKVFRKR